MEINGTTKKMGIIGSPVSHSLSPLIHNTFARRLGDNIIYTAFDVTKNNFVTAIKGAEALGIIGFNVTAPHKATAAQIAISIDHLAKQVNAINLLKLTRDGYIGYNTDIYGICKTFEHHKIDIANKTVTIIGAGGAGRAAAIAMAQMCAKKINIANRTYSKANVLAKSLRMHYNIDIDVCELGMPSVADILILATTPDYAPPSFDQFDIIFDVNYHPPNRIPRAFGGIEMLVYQAVKTYEILLETNVPHDIIDEILMTIKGRLLC